MTFMFIMLDPIPFQAQLFGQVRFMILNLSEYVPPSKLQHMDKWEI